MGIFLPLPGFFRAASSLLLHCCCQCLPGGGLHQLLCPPSATILILTSEIAKMTSSQLGALFVSKTLELWPKAPFTVELLVAWVGCRPSGLKD